MTFRLTNGRSLLLLLLIGIGLLYPLWTTGDIVYSRDSDIIAEHVGIKTIERESVAEGRFPLWNPSMNSGTPAFANPQSMYLFPFDLLFLALPIGIATNLVILLNFLLAGAAMFLFCRRHFRHPAAALLAATAYMLSHRFLAMIYAGWLPKLSMFALTPLLFWACDLVLERPTRRRSAVLALVGAITLLQGDMQQLYYAAVAAAAWIALRLAAAGWRRSGATLSGLALGGLLAAMLAAPALLPRLEFAALSTRTEPSFAFLLQGAPAPSDLLTFLRPHDRTPDGDIRDGFWENNFYFGCWMAPLWILAAWGRHRRAALALAAGIAVAVFLCFDTPVLRALYEHFPGFNLFRQSSRILFLAQFFAAVLAGLGVDAGLGLPRLGPRLGAALAGLLLLAPVLDFALREGRLIATAPLAAALPRNVFDAALDRRHNPGRVLAIGREPFPNLGRAALLYGTAAWHGIDLVNGVGSLELRSYIEYFIVMEYGTTAALPHHPLGWTDCTQIARPELLRALDARYIVGDPALDLASIGATKVWQSPANPVFVFFAGVESIPLAVWRLKHPLGPAYFATAVHPVDDEAGSLRALARSASARDAWVFGIGAAADHLDFSGGAASFLERGYNRYRYDVASAGNNFLILSQVWYPGWRATLDGAPLALYRTNHALLGCVVPPGRHELTLEMTSPPLRHGLWAAAVAAVATAVLLLP